MSNQSNSTNSGGIGFFGLLTIVFVVLKLTGIIHWPWLWVLAPFWLPIVVLLAGMAIVFGVTFMLELRK